MQRQGYLLGSLEAAVQAHGPALVQLQNRRTLVQSLRTEHRKALGLHTYRGSLAIAPYRIHDAVLQVEVEGIAVLVELGIVGSLNTHAPSVSTVPTVAPHLQAVKNVVERFLPILRTPLGVSSRRSPLRLRYPASSRRRSSSRSFSSSRRPSGPRICSSASASTSWSEPWRPTLANCSWSLSAFWSSSIRCMACSNGTPSAPENSYERRSSEDRKSRLACNSANSAASSSSSKAALSISWSSCRRSSGRLLNRDCIWAICEASCCTNCSRFCGGLGPNILPYFCINPSKSGCSPQTCWSNM